MFGRVSQVVSGTCRYFRGPTMLGGNQISNLLVRVTVGFSSKILRLLHLLRLLGIGVHMSGPQHAAKHPQDSD